MVVLLLLTQLPLSFSMMDTSPDFSDPTLQAAGAATGSMITGAAAAVVGAAIGAAETPVGNGKEQQTPAAATKPFKGCCIAGCDNPGAHRVSKKQLEKLAATIQTDSKGAAKLEFDLKKSDQVCEPCTFLVIKAHINDSSTCRARRARPRLLWCWWRRRRYRR